MPGKDPGLLLVELARIELDMATLEPALLGLDLCLAMRSEIEDIIDGEGDLTELPFEERIEMLRSRSSTGDFALVLSSWGLKLDRSGVLTPADD